jgi:hypothetical protein
MAPFFIQEELNAIRKKREEYGLPGPEDEESKLGKTPDELAGLTKEEQ